MANNNDSIYYDLYHEGEQEVEKSKGAKIVSTIFKTVGITLIVAVYALLMFRIWSQQEPSAAKKYLWTEKALAAAAEKGDAFEIITQTPENYVYRDPETGETTVIQRDEYYTTDSEKGSPIDGNYKFSNFCYTPAAGQVQVSFRYNRAVLPYLQEDMGVTELPEYPFVFALQTGDGRLYTEYRFVAAKRGLHTYRRLVFEGLPESLKDLGTLLYLQVYYAGDSVDLQKPYLSMIIYDQNLLPGEKDAPYQTRKEKIPSSPSALEPMPTYSKTKEQPQKETP